MARVHVHNHYVVILNNFSSCIQTLDKMDSYNLYSECKDYFAEFLCFMFTFLYFQIEYYLIENQIFSQEVIQVQYAFHISHRLCSIFLVVNQTFLL